MGAANVVGSLARPPSSGDEPGDKGTDARQGNDCKPVGGSPFASFEARFRSDRDFGSGFKASLKRNGRQTFGPPMPCNACCCPLRSLWFAAQGALRPLFVERFLGASHSATAPLVHHLCSIVNQNSKKFKGHTTL